MKVCGCSIVANSAYVDERICMKYGEGAKINIAVKKNKYCNGDKIEPLPHEKSPERELPTGAQLSEICPILLKKKEGVIPSPNGWP